MAPRSRPTATDEEWLSVRDASVLLGVSPATLRRWADAGTIEAFATPGGHRRYSRRAVEAMLPTTHGGHRLLEMGETPERLSRLYRRVLHRMVAGTPWVEALDAVQRGPYREHGRRIGSSLLYYLDAEDDESREAAMIVAEDACREYGQLARTNGSGLADTIELFMRFRMIFLHEMGSVARRHAYDTAEATELLESTHRAFDRLLRAVLAGYQSAEESTVATSPAGVPGVPSSAGRGPR